MITAKLNAKEERRLLRGHLWAYRNEFRHLPDLTDGEIVDVHATNGRFVGRGFYQAEGGIAVRILSRRRTAIDADFFRERFNTAKALRDRLYPGTDVYRWVHGETDGLPGLLVDRFGAVVALSTTCAFYDLMAETLADVLLGFDGVTGVVFRGNLFRRFGDASDEARCTLHGFALTVDLEEGQKTGLFLDQRDNWPLVEPFARNAAVLDGHCYTGVWSLHAARAGARSVIGVDTSQPALDRAQGHAAANDLSDRCAFRCADVETVLKEDARYDAIILDPPALAKSRGHAVKALRRYQALNRAALAALNPGGVLITCSCSHFVDDAAFLEMVKRAANSAQRQGRILAVRGAAPDHPVLLAMPETAYLTCVVLQVE